MSKRVTYMKVVPQTDEEKLKMYMKQPKKKLAEMLVNCNNTLEQFRAYVDNKGTEGTGFQQQVFPDSMND